MEKENIDIKKRVSYIEATNIGTLVAFRLPNGKVKTAKVIKKSTNDKKFKVETEYGMQYIVPYSNVLWVQTDNNKKWPKGIYNLLKGRA